MGSSLRQAQGTPSQAQGTPSQAQGTLSYKLTVLLYTSLRKPAFRDIVKNI